MKQSRSKLAALRLSCPQATVSIRIWLPDLSSRVSSWPWCWQQPTTSAPALTLLGRRWGYVFTTPGCWDLRAIRGDAIADAWIQVVTR